MSEFLRLPAEQAYAAELDAVAKADTYARPSGWRLSPRAVRLYVLGGMAGEVSVTPKYVGDARLVELCIATLLTDRALLLSGPPGTGKTRLSEHLAAAVSGDSTLLLQGTMGTSEEQLRYGWNYALLLANGPSPDALVPSPVYTAMEEGRIARFEELTRCVPEVQDALISILSEKTLSIPELKRELRAVKGFSMIATANNRDQGTHSLSAALQRRFCRVELTPPHSLDAEVALVERRAAELAAESGLGSRLDAAGVRRVVTILRELREGKSPEGKLRSPTAPCSPSDAISVLNGAAALSDSFGDGRVTDEHCAALLQTAVVGGQSRDAEVWEEYRRTVLRERGADWRVYAETEAAL